MVRACQEKGRRAQAIYKKNVRCTSTSRPTRKETERKTNQLEGRTITIGLFRRSYIFNITLSYIERSK